MVGVGSRYRKRLYQGIRRGWIKVQEEVGSRYRKGDESSYMNGVGSKHDRWRTIV